MLVPELAGGRTTLRGAEAHHLRDVLRLRPGADVEAFDGRGTEASARVVSLSKEAVVLEVEEPGAGSVEAPIALTLAVSLLKGDKLADVVRKGTELGVVRFRLFGCRRADVPTLSSSKLRRYRRVAEEAAKQSRRSLVPDVVEPTDLHELPLDGAALVAAPRAASSVREALAQVPAGALTLITGPEGGLEPGELAALEARGARAVRLGPRILRAETAPVALTAAVLLPDAL
ncbi:MAG: RsmE family RNA methyltransferase [Deinococcales bacterium]